MLWRVFSLFAEDGQKRKKHNPKRIWWKCRKNHSTIEAMNSHKRKCDGYEDGSDDEEPKEDEHKDKENEEDYIEVELIGD